MMKKGSAGSCRWAKRLTALALVLLTLLSCAGTAFAEEEPKTPAAIQDTYEVNGVTFFKVDSENFDDPPHYFRDLMGLKSSELEGRSMAQLWLETGVGMTFSGQSDYTDDQLGFTPDEAFSAMQAGIESGSTLAENYEFKAGSTDAIYARSFEQAEQRLLKSVPEDMMNMLKKHNMTFLATPDRSKDKTALEAAQKQQDVVSAIAYGWRGNCIFFTQVYFTDFQAVPLLPDNSGSNYVSSTIRNNKNAEKTYASNVKNMTLSPVTATQSVSTSWSASVTSTVEHSSAYTFSEAFKIGAKFAFKLVDISPEFTFTATQAFSDGWSKATTETKSGSIKENVSVTLPPYTNVLLEQGSSSSEVETRYNCPVGLKYKTTVRTAKMTIMPLYAADGQIMGDVVSYKQYCFNVPFGPDARTDLYKRALRDGDLDTDMADIHWPNVLAVNAVRNTIETVASHVPVAPVGATFNETLDTSYTEVKSLAPTDPLTIVRILPPDLNFINSQQLNYNKLNYLHADMKVGESSYTNYLKLQGENTYGAEYYGFSYRNGHWVVIRPDGTDWNDDTAPVKVEQDPATGYIRYTAVKPGTCFLKYVIDENCYSTAGNLDTYAKNDELESTAALEITVSGVKEESAPIGTVHISGNYFGFVGKEPERLDKEDGLTVSIQDLSGKELEMPYVWEKMELDSHGISINDENKVFFTKTGKYHVRVVCDEINAKSDWYEIEVHNYTFTPEGASIMASCPDPECDDVMFTVHAPKKTVYGDGQSAWASVTGRIPGMTPPIVKYRRGTEELNAPPRDAGTYSASITIGSATAEVEYTIEQAESSIIDTPVASGIIAGQPLASSQLKDGKGSTAGRFLWKDETVRPTLSDSQRTPYEVIFVPDSANYKPSSCTVMLSVNTDPVEVVTVPRAKVLTYNDSAQQLVEAGEAAKGKILYAMTQDTTTDAEALSYSEEIPAATEAGSYCVWYKTVNAGGELDAGPYLILVTIDKAVPTVDFPVRKLPATGEDQPLIVDPIVTPEKDVTVHYSLGDTENELTTFPAAKDIGEYLVYYRIESRNPSCESVPYSDPVRISIQSEMEEQLPDLKVSLEGWVYGEEANTPAVTGNEDYPVSFLYKALGDEDENYDEAVPNDAGDYTVRAVVTSPDYYGEATATADFRIEKRVPVPGEDFDIQPRVLFFTGDYQPLVRIAVKDGTTLKLWCSFDRYNTLAGTPKKQNSGTYEIWYRVSGDRNYEELNEWSGPVVSTILDETDMIVPDALEIIGEEAFAGITAESVYLRENVKRVEEYAFSDCERLAVLIVAGAETEIADSALAGCANVTVYGLPGSGAQTFAEKNHFDFVSLTGQGA